MKLPIITNAKRVLRSWEEGNPVDPEHSVSGEGDELDRHVIPGLLAELRALIRRLRPNRDGKIEFDQQAASLLGQRLEIPPADAADKRFWQRLSITQASDIVEWRWGKQPASIPRNRWLGGVKDTFRRLWLRAQLVRRDNSPPELRFHLATRGDEDYWVGIIERLISECRELVCILTEQFFPEGNESAQSTQRMEHYRRTIMRLRQIRPCRVFEAMTRSELEAMVREVMAVTRPADAAPRGQKSGSRKGRRTTSRPTRRGRGKNRRSG